MNKVTIKEIKFKSRNINWKEVERKLKKYVGREYTIIETNEIIQLAWWFVAMTKNSCICMIL